MAILIGSCFHRLKNFAEVLSVFSVFSNFSKPFFDQSNDDNFFQDCFELFYSLMISCADSGIVSETNSFKLES
jgi:hypothetical protein